MASGILVIGFESQNTGFFQEITDIAKCCSELKLLWQDSKLVLSLPGLQIDSVHWKVFCGDQEIKLTVKEYALLSLLVLNEGHVLTYEQIYRSVWGEEAFGGVNNAIKCHIRNLRGKLYAAEPEAPFSIRCVREVGYCLEVDSEKRAVT